MEFQPFDEKLEIFKRHDEEPEINENTEEPQTLLSYVIKYKLYHINTTLECMSVVMDSIVFDRFEKAIDNRINASKAFDMFLSCSDILENSTRALYVDSLTDTRLWQDYKTEFEMQLICKNLQNNQEIIIASKNMPGATLAKWDAWSLEFEWYNLFGYNESDQDHFIRLFER